MKKLIYCLMASIIFFVSCQKEGEKTHDDLQSILLGKDTLSMYTGDVFNIDYTLIPSNYDPSMLVWNSSDTSVISLKNGEVKAKKEGRSKITVTNLVNTVSVSCMVNVIDLLKKGLIAYYPFDGNAVDSSGNKNHGTVYNITSVSNRFGKANSAYYFNGNNSYITVADKEALRLNNTNFTLSAWVRLDTYNYSFGSMILNKHFTGVDNGWTWSITGQASNPFAVGFFGPGGGSNNAYGAKLLGLNAWHMVTSVYSLSEHKLTMYVDGVLDNETYNVLSPNAVIDATLYIGRDNPSIYSGGYFFNGAMDDIRVYNRAITLSEIQKLYSASK